MGLREPNRMVPTYLLRKLKNAQRRHVDSEEVKRIVYEIDLVIGGDIESTDLPGNGARTAKGVAQ